MNNIYKAIVIGGGASGLICAIELGQGKNALKGGDVLLLEKNNRVGKKLIATGNGQGNLTNANITPDNYYGNREFIKNSFDALSSIDLVDYLEKLGISLCEDASGKMYPVSKQASAVLDVLRAKIDKIGFQVKTDTAVNQINKKNNYYEVVTNNGTFNAQNIVLAVGGSAGKQFGTDGSSYSLAVTLGHKTTPLYPSLVQLKTDNGKIRSLKGIKERATVIAYNGHTKLKSVTGDLLFTDYGVSGDAIFKISSVITDNPNPKIKLEFLPDYTEKQVEEMLINSKKNCPLYNDNAFVGILNKQLGNVILKSTNGSEPKDLAKAVKNFWINVTGNLGFNYAQVTKGGINVEDVDYKTFESKINKGLYFSGEVLDVDGDCGGYNLTFAFKTGIICASEIKNKLS